MSMPIKLLRRVLPHRWLLTAAVLSLWAEAAGAQMQGLRSSINLDVGAGQYAGEIQVPVNKSQIVRIGQPFSDLSIANTEIADIRAVTNQSVYILGKALGSTTLSVYGRNKNLLAVLDVAITHDVEGLKRRLSELMPQDRIEVRSVNQSIVLSGNVLSADRAATAASIAERVAPGAVTNLLRVARSQQVMLAVRFAEVKRTAVEELGLNTNFLFNSGHAAVQLLTGVGAAASTFGRLSGSITQGNFSGETLLTALQQRGVVKILAEPNLIALSGETASFLAGGEYPIPVAQSAGIVGGITVEFKQFGVSLAFTPTVIGDNAISLVVAPEVSAIDQTTSVQLNGFSIPGIVTRRARTTVDLRDGQSFAIAGLIQSDFRDRVNKFPLLGEIPVIGALFRSADFQRAESELVIIVTPHIVKPAHMAELKLPTDTFVPPSRKDLFLDGKVEGADRAPAAPQRLPSGLPGSGGLDGRFGHVIQ